MRKEKFTMSMEKYSSFILKRKIKTATFRGNGLFYLVFGNASSDNSLKKS